MTDAADLRHRLEVALAEDDLMPATRATIADFLRVVPPSDRRLHELAQLVASCPVGGCRLCEGAVLEVEGIILASGGATERTVTE